MPRIPRLLLAGLAALVLAAPMASAAHSVTVTSGSADGSTYTMTVNVDKFTLVDFAGKSAKKGEGHIHYLVNGQDACSAGKADCRAPTDYATTAKSFTFTNLEKGDKLRAELVLSDHTASGTDANGNLNGARVLSEEVVVKGSMGLPSPAGVLVALGLLGLAFVARRKA
jgi:hypothetical protein